MDATVLVQIFTAALIALGMAIAGYLVSIVVVRLIAPVAQRFLDPGLANFITGIARIGVLLLTLKLIVDQTGAAGVLVVVITALTGAFALGSERMASDLVAGINLLLVRYYKVGDLVTIGEHQGRISGVTLSHTSLSNGDRDRIIIPNSEVLGQVIVNHTAVPGARIRAKVQISGPHDREAVMDVMLKAAQTFEPQLTGPHDQPSVRLNQVVKNDNAIDISTYSVRVIVPEYYYGKDDVLLLHVMRALDNQSIAPQQSAVA